MVLQSKVLAILLAILLVYISATILADNRIPVLAFRSNYRYKNPRVPGIQTDTAISMASLDHGPHQRATSPVIIAGAGVIGCSSAYFLAKDFGIASTLVDPTGTIAPAASGKAGGFLALDWNDYSPVGPLARRSFQLHQDIANDVGASRLDYRRLTCAAISATTSTSIGTTSVSRPKGKKLQGVEWATGDAVQGVRSLGDEQTIAQVHPKKLCDTFWDETCRLAPTSRLVQGKVSGAVYGENEVGTELSGVKVTTKNGQEIISGKTLLYACGPWTSNVMTGVKYHSVIMPTETVLNQCVFFSGCGDPEVYVRPDQTAYCTGFPDDPIRVTEEPGQEEVRQDAIELIETAVKQASNLQATKAQQCIYQACYLPSTPDGIPIIGSLPDYPGCFVATGHSCWGILMGPATGEAIAHLIATGTSPYVDLSPFVPSRMRNMQVVTTK